ncbi:hypothetical protein EAE99_000579 [Botrytis elliptica]|nr:hypothetical protein EAE99_000579 [Botrytis elliptica]
MAYELKFLDTCLFCPVTLLVDTSTATTSLRSLLCTLGLQGEFTGTAKSTATRRIINGTGPALCAGLHVLTNNISKFYWGYVFVRNLDIQSTKE